MKLGHMAAQAAHDTAQHCADYWVQLTFALGFALCIVLDLWLVWTKRTTISMRVWINTHLHPTMQGAGVGVGIAACYLLRDSWPAVMIAGMCIGHLFLTSEYVPDEKGK